MSIAVACVARKVIVASDADEMSDVEKKGEGTRTCWEIEGHRDAEYSVA